MCSFDQHFHCHLFTAPLIKRRENISRAEEVEGPKTVSKSISSPSREGKMSLKGSRENVNPNIKINKPQKKNNVALTPKIKKSKKVTNAKQHTQPPQPDLLVPTRTLRPRACNQTHQKGHVCNGQCITPLPARLTSMNGRRKKKILAAIPLDQGEADNPNAEKIVERKPKVNKKEWRQNLEVDLFKRLSRHSLLSESALLDMLSKADEAPKIEKETVKEPVPLRSKTLAGIAHHIARKRCKNIIVMSGAGISCSAGIPDFRSPGTGLYYNLQKYDLPTPTAIFDINYFVKRPEPFFTLAKELYPGNFKPTPVHYFIRLLHEKGLLLRNYTQNIDGLERIAGLPAESIVEAHGSFYSAHCISCGREYLPADVKEKIFAEQIPHCVECDGLVKPDITFFGESLPERFFVMAEQDFAKCDLLIVLGTSLKVQPFNELIKKVGPSTPRFLINRETVGTEIGGKADEHCFRFDECDNQRDVQYLGNCDSAVNLLVDLLEWRTDFDALMA